MCLYEISENLHTLKGEMFETKSAPWEGCAPSSIKLEARGLFAHRLESL